MCASDQQVNIQRLQIAVEMQLAIPNHTSVFHQLPTGSVAAIDAVDDRAGTPARVDAAVWVTAGTPEARAVVDWPVQVDKLDHDPAIFDSKIGVAPQSRHGRRVAKARPLDANRDRYLTMLVHRRQAVDEEARVVHRHPAEILHAVVKC